MASGPTSEATLREIATDQGILRYREVGDGPPLMLLHGSDPGVTGWRDFRGVLPAFAENFRCLILEFPGFGVSDNVDGHPMLTALDSFVRFMNALGLDRVSIIGNSMGGGVGIDYAIANPGKVRRLVTIGGGGPNLFSAAPSEAIRVLQDFSDNPSRERLIRWMHAMLFDPTTLTEQLIEERWNGTAQPHTLASARRTFAQSAFADVVKASAHPHGPPPWAMMHAIIAPTLLCWGRDDRVTPLDMALIPMRTIPNAELHVFPNCGHWVMLEQTAAFTSAALAFLLRQDVIGA
ncbi:alpha/beta hydrolase [Mycobacterium sp. 852002-51163_SCH5372311]|uniref:alpha/beta fold hydrolase n=1 Tax=Mycobacterium sp. 852002-51163_SCH5372311 TaxID=1834097 RepID=UPI0007FBBBF5|nr:alpha/beta fold hydrolase [Mycobacterium sp. 852002-51163_SCH5372311]OBF86133.1 alpha/beta hydrolase [Mycobacterium sp. 852002-51163_SCH5372311]